MTRKIYYPPEKLPFTDEIRKSILELFGLPRGNNSPEIKADSQFALEILYLGGNSHLGRLLILHRSPNLITPEYEIQIEGQLEGRLKEVEEIIGL